MNSFEYKHLLPDNFSSNSNIWIYQASRRFTMSEALDIEDKLQQFVSTWNSHGVPVKGYANLFFGQFIVLIADGTAVRVSGCSIDSSVKIIKTISQAFHTDLFDRQLLAFIIKDKIELLPLSQLPYAISNQFITPDTLYFNNLVNTKEEFENKWIVPAKDSWLAARFDKIVR